MIKKHISFGKHWTTENSNETYTIEDKLVDGDTFYSALMHIGNSSLYEEQEDSRGSYKTGIAYGSFVTFTAKEQKS